MYIGLQVGRGIAALLVVLYHATQGGDFFYGDKAFGEFWSFGFIGVDFFFVLSGFIIYWAHADDSQGFDTATTYSKKRLIRIYPPFILISLALLLAYNFFPNLSEGQREIGIISSLFLIPTPSLAPALSVSWTLMHEMLFYTLFLLLYFNRFLLHAILIIWGLSIFSLNGLLTTDTFLMNFVFHPHNLQFLFGVIAAILVKKNVRKQSFILIGLIFLFSYIAWHHSGLYENISVLILKTYLGFCFMFIVLGLCSIESKIIYPKMLVFLGAASYSIYLIHNPVISIANRIAHKIYLVEPLVPEVYFIFSVSLGLLAGIFYYLLWEKPSMNFLKKLLLK